MANFYHRQMPKALINNGLSLTASSYEASKYVGTAKTATLRIEMCPVARPGGDWEYWNQAFVILLSI